ncbi:MAG: indole-3-glycerol phosphate synthase TrpC [Robiginitomaculum sp.]
MPKHKIDILEKIAAYKRNEVKQLKEESDWETLEMAISVQSKPRGFLKRLQEISQTSPALIAEIKQASPSKGIIREFMLPTAVAQAYQKGGAACLSVLTDGPSFQGSDLYLKQARAITQLPVLRKDFMIDPIQILQSRMFGADAILIIMAMVDDDMAKALYDTAADFDMDALVEVHDKKEMIRALKLGASLIGINNRDLRTFKTSLTIFEDLAPLVHKDVFLIAESGINTVDDIVRLSSAGANGFLVGESLMREKDIKEATLKLLGKRE